MSALKRLTVLVAALAMSLLVVLLMFWGLATLAGLIIGDESELDGERAMSLIIGTLAVAAMLVGLVSLGLRGRRRRRRDTEPEPTTESEHEQP